MEADSIHIHRIGLLTHRAGGSPEKDMITVPCRGNGITAYSLQPGESLRREAPI